MGARRNVCGGAGGKSIRVVGDYSNAVSVGMRRMFFHPEGPWDYACLRVVLARVHTACRVKEAWLAAPTLLGESTTC